MIKDSGMKKHRHVLVVGAGIAGIQCALDIAEAGLKVWLVEKDNYIGGMLHEIYRQFPTNRCGMCRILPTHTEDLFSQSCLRYGLSHPNIRLITGGEIVEIEKVYAGVEVMIKVGRKGSLRQKFDGIIWANGFREFDARKIEKYGYLRFQNVLTGLELENLLVTNQFCRRTDGKLPRSIGFIQCVGSRNSRINANYCSGICCMYAIKEALLLKERHPQMRISIFYIDLRVYGKNYYKYFLKAKEQGIEFIRCIPSVEENPLNRNLILTYEDNAGKIKREEFDLIVLSTGAQAPDASFLSNSKLKLRLNGFGFYEGSDTSVIDYACGCFVEPKDIESSILEASAAALKTLQRLAVTVSGFKNRVVVIGAGITGIKVALNIARLGISVCLIEKSGQLGGQALHLSETIRGFRVRELLNKMVEMVKGDRLIQLILQSRVRMIKRKRDGYELWLDDRNGATQMIEAMAIVVATGAEQYKPTEYCYGQDPRIITQRELEQKLQNHSTIQHLNITMIQCVGSLSETHPYCSRFCCTQAIKNALKIKAQSFKSEIYILFREMMTPGFNEGYYTRARENGINFIRYGPDRLPEVKLIDGDLLVMVYDTSLGEVISIHPDLVVLSNGITPNLEENKMLAQILDIEMDSNGFFIELDPKFLPLNSRRPGIFICGTAHSPRTIEESIVQADAVSMKVFSFVLQQQREIPNLANLPCVDEDYCSGCGLCVSVCPNNARAIDEEKKISMVLPALCQSCALCTTICPNGATEIPSFSRVHMMADINSE